MTMIYRLRTHRSARIVLVLLACALTILCWWRVQIGNGFSILIGDWLDGRIQVSITEHWFAVFRGRDRWNDMAYFYPWHDTLGYNDGYFLYGVFHSGFRALGADPFAAFELTLGVIRTIGFLACYVMAMDVLGLGLGWSILAAAIFSLSNGAYVQQGHAQLLAVSFAPLIVWLCWKTCRFLQCRARVKAILWGSATAALYGAWLLSGFYTAWYLTFFTGMALIGISVSQFGKSGVFDRVRKYLDMPAILAIGAIGLICLVPFLIVYLPKAMETGGHPFSEAMTYSPSVIDLLHVSSGNWIFGGFDRWIADTFRPGFPDIGEKSIGFPPLFLAFSGAGAIAALHGRQDRTLLWRAIAIGTVLSIVLFVHVRGHTLWYGIYLYVPGARAVRTIGRYAIFLALPMTLLAVSFLSSRVGRWPRWVLVGCVALLVMEEFTATPSIGLDRAEELRVLANVHTVPAECKVFFVSKPWTRKSTGSFDTDKLFPHNGDAMLISEVIGVPTINGHSTFEPPDWNFEDSGRPDYLARVQTYANAHHISGLCGLDVATGRWDTRPFR